MSKSLFKLEEIFRHLIHGPTEPSSGPPVRLGNKELLDSMRRLAEEHISDPRFTTSDAAESLGMSRMHLNRRLRSLTGQSTHQFIQEMRLESARTALVTQSLPVSAIAAEAGFKSVSQFTTAFRFRYGAPPAEYRRQNPDGAPPGPPRS
jgi:transcriptional regulator GlxA family with amidase domain